MATALHYGTETFALATTADLEELSADIRRAIRGGGDWVKFAGAHGDRTIFASVAQYIWINDAVPEGKGRVMVH